MSLSLTLSSLCGRFLLGTKRGFTTGTTESKVESMQWRHASSPPPRKFRTLPSAGKLMATIFWDSKGLLLINYLPPKTTMNGQYYASLLLKLRDAIKEKRRGMLKQ